MRRSHALVGIQVLAATLVAGLMLALPGSPGSAAVGPDTLTIVSSNTSPYPPYTGSYEDGQELMILLNIDEGDNDVYSASLETDKSGGSYQPIAGQTGKTTNKYGRYVFTYAPTGEQNVRATWQQNGVTRYSEVLHLTPQVPVPVAPTGPDVGNLIESPTTFAAGDSIKLTADFPSGTFPITLYKETAPDVWSSLGTKQSNSSGNADFSYVVNGSAKLFARKANNDRTEVDVVAPTPALNLHIQRDCSGNDCANTATASGAFDPAVEGRAVKLEYKNSSGTWTQIGTPGASGADGKVAIQFDLTGIPQWTARAYRLVSTGDASNPTITSRETQFMPGPTQLGANVLRVDVDKGIFPTSKSAEYTGKATLSTNGVVALDHVALENFGVRGTSTAKFDKRAYKLKFLDKPPSGKTVFGMPRAKSWSLLANWLDRSNVRDKVGLELGRKLNKISWTPQSRYVEMFLNDQYRGAYLMTESVKIDGSRVDVDETQGMIMETDGRSVSDSLLGFQSLKGIVFQFKDPDERKSNPDGTPDPKSVTSAKLTAIKNRVNEFESKLYSSSTREQYPDYIDVDSAIDFYLVKEFTKDRDADFYRSNYFSWDPSGRVGKPLSDGKFHFGPAWDFDRSAGITSENDTIHNYVQSPAGFYLRGTGIDNDHPNYKTHWFVQLFKSQSFRDKVDARWAELKAAGVFQSASGMARAAATELGVGAENDRKRWVGPRQYADHGTYQGEIDYVANWYDQRFAWMDANL